jgi:hypothetical protein
MVGSSGIGCGGMYRRSRRLMPLREEVAVLCIRLCSCTHVFLRLSVDSVEVA